MTEWKIGTLAFDQSAIRERRQRELQAKKPVAVINQAQVDLNKNTADLKKLLNKLEEEVKWPEYESTYEITREKWDEPVFVKKNIDDRNGFGGAFIPPNYRPVSQTKQEYLDMRAGIDPVIMTELDFQLKHLVKEFTDTIRKLFYCLKNPATRNEADHEMMVRGYTDQMTKYADQMEEYVKTMAGTPYMARVQSAVRSVESCMQGEKFRYEKEKA